MTSFNDQANPPPLADLVKDFTDPGETVIDPFLGSGTTGAACAALGRRFVGIEIDEGWFLGACERIRKVYDDGMFSQPALVRIWT
jgi:site-specific DNA-methyltransferase (adenine-specific)